jgi:hypothetical protein
MQRFANAATQASLYEPIIYERQARQERDQQAGTKQPKSPVFPSQN